MASIRIKIAEEAEYGSIYRIYAPFIENSVISFETQLPGPEAFADRIRSTLPEFPWLVCVVDDTIAGYAYAGRHRQRQAYQWTVETSVYVHPSHTRLGIATGLYTTLLHVLTGQGFKTALAGITLPDAASVSFHEKMGFTPAGIYKNTGYKHGAWHDVGWWQRPLAPYGPDPGKPLTLHGYIEKEMIGPFLEAGLRCIRC